MTESLCLQEVLQQYIIMKPPDIFFICYQPDTGERAALLSNLSMNILCHFVCYLCVWLLLTSAHHSFFTVCQVCSTALVAHAQAIQVNSILKGVCTRPPVLIVIACLHLPGCCVAVILTDNHSIVFHKSSVYESHESPFHPARSLFTCRMKWNSQQFNLDFPAPALFLGGPDVTFNSWNAWSSSLNFSLWNFIDELVGHVQTLSVGDSLSRAAWKANHTLTTIF